MMRTNLFDELMSIHRSFDRLFDRVFDGFRWTALPEAGSATWIPPVQTYVHDNNLYVRVFLPGVDPKDIDISLTENVLTVRGERKPAFEGEFLLNEIPSGKFERRVSLPEGVVGDADKCNARYVNGVLEIALPAPAQMVTRHIPIQGVESKKQIAA